MNGHDDRAVGLPNIVDLFAGPGGLDVAAHWLGIPAVGIEWDPNACASRRLAGLDTIQGDVRDFGPADFPDANILAGGPPCQTFTMAGGGTGRRSLRQVLVGIERIGNGQDVTELLATLDDERTGLVLEPLRWVLEADRGLAPFEAVILEQVPAVLPVWEATARVLRGLGYGVRTGVLRTEEFGVPQTRKRAILIAIRGSVPHLPAATHRRYRKGVPRGEGPPNLLPWNTIGDALSRGSAGTVVSNYGSGGNPRARGHRAFNLPSATVTGKIFRNRVLGPEGEELPRFTQSEAGQLQTFPPDFPWAGRDVAQQIGNAIPPRLAAHIIASALGVFVDERSLGKAVASSWSPAACRTVVTSTRYSDSSVISVDKDQDSILKLDLFATDVEQATSDYTATYRPG